MRCRSMAATAIRANTASSGCSATCASPRSTRAPTRSSASSSPAKSKRKSHEFERATVLSIITAEEAANLVRDADTLIVGGNGGTGVAKAILDALEQRFLDGGGPHGLALIHITGGGALSLKGLSHPHLGGRRRLYQHGARRHHARRSVDRAGRAQRRRHRDLPSEADRQARLDPSADGQDPGLSDRPYGA